MLLSPHVDELAAAYVGKLKVKPPGFMTMASLTCMPAFAGMTAFDWLHVQSCIHVAYHMGDDRRLSETGKQISMCLIGLCRRPLNIIRLLE